MCPLQAKPGVARPGSSPGCRRALLDILPVGLNPPVIGEGLVGVVVLPRGGADRVSVIQGSFSGERRHRQGNHQQRHHRQHHNVALQTLPPFVRAGSRLHHWLPATPIGAHHR